MNGSTVAEREQEMPKEVACFCFAKRVGGSHRFSVRVSRFGNDLSKRKRFGIAPKGVFHRDHGRSHIAVFLDYASETIPNPTTEDKLVRRADGKQTAESRMRVTRPDGNFADQKGESVFLLR